MGDQGVRLSTLDDIYRFAEVVVRSKLTPKGMDSPEAVMVAIQYGLEVGLSPMAALQNIMAVNNRPSLFGDAQLGLVRASGYCEFYREALTDDASHLVFIDMCFAAIDGDIDKVKELRKELARAGAAIKLNKDDQGFSSCTLRKGSEPDFGRFTIELAKRAKLWGKELWQQYPERMLRFRSRSFLLRDNYGDVLKGLLEFGEAQDIVIDHRPAPALPLGRSSLRGQNGTPAAVDEQAQFIPPESVYHEQAPPEDSPRHDSPRATQEQHDTIQALLTQLGWATKNYLNDFRKIRGGADPSEMTVKVADEEITRLQGLAGEVKSE